MEGGREQNYYPGFVDALSNVVLTLVFVLVIFVFALLMSSDKVAQKMNQVVEAEKAAQEGQLQLDKALAELVRAREQGPKTSGTQQGCLSFSKSDSRQKAEVDMSTLSVIIFFSPHAISVTDNTTKVIENFLEIYRAQANDTKAKFVIEAPEDPDSSSPLMARETQLGRMLNLRNTLLSMKIAPRDISLQNIPPLQQKGGYDWVKIYVKK